MPGPTRSDDGVGEGRASGVAKGSSTMAWGINCGINAFGDRKSTDCRHKMAAPNIDAKMTRGLE
jgi:hypothetical protein